MRIVLRLCITLLLALIFAAILSYVAAAQTVLFVVTTLGIWIVLNGLISEYKRNGSFISSQP